MTSETSVSRRGFVAAAASGLAAACAHARRGAPTAPLVLVGTYTTGGRAEGVYLFRMDPDTGALRPAGAVAAGPNPSFLAPRPDGRHVYAVNEVGDYAGAPTGAVAALALDPGAPRLAALGRRASQGGAPCYVSLDRTGRFALVANYTGGSAAALPIAADGTLGEAAAVVRHVGSGPDRARQERPHAHCILADPTNRHALVADLGIDRIVVYRFDDRTGALAPAATPYAALRPGAGPRHLAFHPDGRRLYVVNELDLTLAAFRWDAGAGTLAPLQTVPLLAGPAPAGSTAADLHVAPSGRFLYASVRGADAIAVFAIAGDGTLAPVQRVPSGGSTPRNFALDPSGRFLYAANQRSDSIVVFRVDGTTGRLAPTGHQVAVPAPVCVRFV